MQENICINQAWCKTAIIGKFIVEPVTVWSNASGQTLASHLKQFIESSNNHDVMNTVIAYKAIKKKKKKKKKQQQEEEDEEEELNGPVINSSRGYWMGTIVQAQDPNGSDWEVRRMYPIDALDNHWRYALNDEKEIDVVPAAKFLWTKFEEETRAAGAAINAANRVSRPWKKGHQNAASEHNFNRTVWRLDSRCSARILRRIGGKDSK